MLNRVIYGGKVYYKVVDLAVLFDLSNYKMNKIIEKQEIKAEPLDGFGRIRFVSEQEASKIVVNNEVTILKTEFTDLVETAPIHTVEEAPAKKTKAKTKAPKKEVPIETVVNDCKENVATELEEIAKLQEEHARLMKKGKLTCVKFHNAQKMNIAHKICDKHLGKGNAFIHATLDNVEQMRLIVAELEIESVKLDEVEIQV
ncbi:hypothetical protein ABEW33_23345 [Priestia megaterium]|uniref:hypothetical protein n=1 Tax=Priestia megaterium TaxID=1404 RepID=UPI0030C90DF8